MKNSQRVAWYELAYEKIRRDILPEAPPAVTISVGFPIKKRSGKNMAVGECAFDCFTEHGDGFGAENIITLHPILGDDVIDALATLAHEMIHAALEPDVKHGKGFQKVCKRIGLRKPWTATEPDGDLQNTLRGIALEVEEELGYMPAGFYVPPPPKPKRPSTRRKLECACEKPRKLSVGKTKLEKGPILCGVCREPFRVIDPPDEA